MKFCTILVHMARVNYYDKYDDYIYIEEAFVNYCAKKISQEYIKEHGYMIEPRIKEEYDNVYDCTLPYMEEVMSLYGDALQKIQQERLTLKEANKLCPFTLINESLKRLYEAEYPSKKMIDDEIRKLNCRKNGR